MLAVTDLVVRFPGNQFPLLDGISFSAGTGAIALMGASGSGKTTLFRCLSGLQAAESGSITVDGDPISPSKASGGIDERVSVIFQDYRLVDFLTVGENLKLARELRGLSPDSKEDSILDAVGLKGFGSRELRTLSGGQLQRVAIARALSLNPSLILADEPTGALDRDNSERIARLLKMIGDDRGIPVLIATHDARVASHCDHVLELPGDGTLRERYAD